MTVAFILKDLFRERRNLEKASPPCAAFHVYTAQNNQYTKVAFGGLACPELL